MDKDSIIELQKLDCNCNDCGFLQRDLERFQKSLNDHHRWQLDYFNSVKANLYKKAKYWRLKGFIDKCDDLEVEADKLKFQFDKKEALINYGECLKYNKSITFIPNTIQLHTQECFKHRRV